MRSSSAGRKSSTAPTRITRDDKGSRSEIRPGYLPKARPSAGEGSGIPRPRIRSDSSERNSIRRSNLKPGGPPSRLTNVSQTPTTPRVSNVPRFHQDLPTGLRAKSPSADRASSLMNKKGARKDHRPSPEMQAEILKRLAIYFKDIPGVLNKRGHFNNPTTIESFITATTILLRDSDMIVKPELTQQNYVIEVPKYMKALHYPGATNPQVTKFLQSVNLPHVFPDVLGWLGWLVVIAEVNAIGATRFSSVDALPFIDTPENSAETQKDLFKTLLHGYSLWNDEKRAGEEEEVFHAYVQRLAQRLGATPEELAKAQAELDDVKARKKIIDEEAARVDKMCIKANERLAALEKEEAEQLALLEEFARRDERDRKEMEEIDLEEAQFALERAKLEAECRELELEIERQEMSAEERDDYVYKCKELKNQLKQYNEHLEGFKKKAYSLEIELTKINDALSKAILEYNRSLVCELPENIMGRNISELQMPESFSFNENIFEMVKAKAKMMNDLTKEMKDEINQLEPVINAHTNTLEGLQERLKAIRQEKLELSEQNQEAKQSMKQLKKYYSEEEAKVQKQIKKLEDEIKEIKKLTPDLKDLNDQLEEVKDQIAARKKKKAFLEERAERFFGRFYETLNNNACEIKKILSRLDDE